MAHDVPDHRRDILRQLTFEDGLPTHEADVEDEDESTEYADGDAPTHNPANGSGE